MRKIIFIITLAVNVSILMQAQPRVPTRVIILTGKGQLTSQNVEVQMDWRGVLLTRFNQPLENATIEIVNADGKVTYQQDIDLLNYLPTNRANTPLKLFLLKVHWKENFICTINHKPSLN